MVLINRWSYIQLVIRGGLLYNLSIRTSKNLTNYKVCSIHILPQQRVPVLCPNVSLTVNVDLLILFAVSLCYPHTTLSLPYFEEGRSFRIFGEVCVWGGGGEEAGLRPRRCTIFTASTEALWRGIH